MITDFFSQPINAKLAMLLIMCPLDDEEKQGWIELMPRMTEDDKLELIKNLQEEIVDITEMENSVRAQTR